MNEPKRMTALEMARRSYDVTTTWDVCSVLCLRPEWSIDQAEGFLREHGGAFANRLLEIGLGVLLQMIESQEQQKAS